MKKKRISGICLVLVLALGMCIGAAAASNLETISAYLNRGITIKLDGQTKTMSDANGKRVYPISYNGTTYVPIRAVSNMLGIDVEWDGANNTVLLGENNTAKDFIREFKPYANKRGVHRVDASPKEIAGKSYTVYITVDGSGWSGQLYYDLGGQYTTLTMKVYSSSDYYSDRVFDFYGDNDTLLKRVEVEPYALPVTVTIDVTGVQQLLIDGYSGLFIMDAVIE